MAEVTATMVKELRERTGAGMMDCKKALQESGADLTKAAEYLRKKGISGAAKKAGRVAAEGLVGSYIHRGRIGVLLEINCETDFVARNEDFKALLTEVAMQIAAMNPGWVRRDEVPASVLEKEKEIQREQLKAAGKPEAIWDKILTGKLEKFYETVCLEDQPWVKDEKKKIKDLVTENIAKIGENITIRRFVRYEVGEGIEKKKEDLADEVAKTVAQA